MKYKVHSYSQDTIGGLGHIHSIEESKSFKTARVIAKKRHNQGNINVSIYEEDEESSMEVLRYANKMN